MTEWNEATRMLLEEQRDFNETEARLHHQDSPLGKYWWNRHDAIAAALREIKTLNTALENVQAECERQDTARRLAEQLLKELETALTEWLNAPSETLCAACVILDAHLPDHYMPTR